MKNLILTTLISLCLAAPAVGTEHYGPTIPRQPDGGELFRSEVIDCHPNDYDNDDPYFYVALGYIWFDESISMYSLLFYSNYSIEEDGLTNPDAMIYGDGTYEGNITIFIRIGDSVERFGSWETFMDKYEESICSIPREEI